MMNSEDNDRPSEPAPSDRVVGRVPSGERDSQLGAQPPTASHRRRGGPSARSASTLEQGVQAPKMPPPARATPSQGVQAPKMPPPADAEAVPVLPRGGLVVMRRSGGLRFSSREVVVYRDGRVVHRRHDDGMTVYGGAAERLGERELAELNDLIVRADFARFAGAARGQPPDRYAYEIAARVGRRLRRVEVFQGAIPESIEPLVRALNALMAQNA